jgi:hypothetical protein
VTGLGAWAKRKLGLLGLLLFELGAGGLELDGYFGIA